MRCPRFLSTVRKENAMAKRTLKNLNLLDDFLFGTLVSHKEFGEAFCRELLQTIFQRKFGKLKVIPQRQYYGDDTEYHGTRLDVYLEEDCAEFREPEALLRFRSRKRKRQKQTAESSKTDAFLPGDCDRMVIEPTLKTS